jgi:hypothetical protein
MQLNVYQNEVPRKIFVPKTDDVTGRGMETTVEEEVSR